MEEIKQALDLKAELDTLRPLNQEQEGKIMQKFRLDWNYHSNHLEGNTLTYGETKALIMFGITAQGKPLKDTLEMTGHNEAIDWVLDVIKGERPLTESFIRELHTVLLVKPYEVDAITPDGKPTKKLIKVGSYKTTPNHVKTKTGEIFYFATPEETGAEMTALLDWYTKKSQEENVNPILLAAEFHYKFIRIHPFDDGNGRTARILMNFILMKFGYPPTIIKSDKESKEEYFAVLQLADAGSIEPFIDFIAANLSRSLQIMIAGAKGESIEEPDDLDKEIALLEQRLNTFEKTKVTKTKEVVYNIYKNSIVNLIDCVILKLSKFDKLYKKTNVEISINGNDLFRSKEQFEKYKYREIEANIEDIGFFYSFSNLKQIGFNDVSYGCFIDFKFDFNSYKIEANFGDFVIEKKYGSEITKDEMETIIKREIQAHKNFLNNTIAEKENKS